MRLRALPIPALLECGIAAKQAKAVAKLMEQEKQWTFIPALLYDAAQICAIHGQYDQAAKLITKAADLGTLLFGEHCDMIVGFREQAQNPQGIPGAGFV